MESTQPQNSVSTWLDRPLNHLLPKVTVELLLIIFIMGVTIISRFYGLGLRVMSHDEVNHVVPSYSFYQGNGYSHDPVTHGPMQFHLVAASYYLFGDNDVTSRIPAALFSIATVAFVLIAWRRYLGKTGSLLAGFFFMISPYLLFYGRYTRNEAFVGLFGVIMLYAVLHYLEKGKNSTLYLYTAVLALHFCTKETSFIYTAEILIFLAMIFLKDVTLKTWRKSTNRNAFILAMLIMLLFIGVALGIGVITAKDGGATTTETQVGIGETTAGLLSDPLNIGLYVSLGLAVIALVIALVILFTDLGIKALRRIRSFDLLILTFSLVMPQLIAFPIKLAGWNPLDYSQPGLIRTSIILVVTTLLAAGIGILWKPRLWVINAVLFYSLFTVLYTSVFTNGQGFFTGLVGSLGYWLSQQAVNRGTQPWYYYAFLQVPMYEYLAALGTLLGIFIGFRHKLFSTVPGFAPAAQPDEIPQATQLDLPIALEDEPVQEGTNPRLPVLILLVYWSIISLVAFSVAGEKMPWLTVHITLPMLLVSGFSLGFLVDRLKLKDINYRTIIAFILVPILLVSLGKTISMITGTNKPFAGHELHQLQATSTFLFSIIAVFASGWGVLKLLEHWKPGHLVELLVVAFFGILSVTTARSAYQANYINYDAGKEFLVYAHSARGPKDVLEQVEDIALRTTEGKNIKVAYIGDALYPYWWYFRDYPNKLWLDKELTRDLLDYPVVISDDVQLTKTQAILKEDYVVFQYKRLVWPMQDYFNLKFKEVMTNLKDPLYRQALSDIWKDKDYTRYSQLKGRNDLTLENWQPSANIHLFVRQDIVARIWPYGVVPSIDGAAQVDPYAEKMISIVPDAFFGTAGAGDGQFNAPRGISIAPDGSIYVADSRNHRIQHFSSEGTWISSWGTFASVDSGSAPGGTFNEPWGIAVDADGFVYVADTWNYRIQKFTADGKFVTMWGTSGTADTNFSFWGPRGIVVDSKGHVLITDTGNNRVVIFDSNGEYISQFGLKGIEFGQFYEPVGLAVDNSDWLYVVDTWNQRIQVFAPDDTGTIYQFVNQWEVAGWDGQSTENKPFITIDPDGKVYVTDPDNFRVLVFEQNGTFLKGWGDYSSGIDGFGKPVGIAAASTDVVWVSDSENNYILKFVLPAGSASPVPQGLPALPASSIQLTYNFSTGLVENPLAQPVYRISEDGMSWIPVIPEGILSLLPLGTTPVLENGLWVINEPTGSLSFRWEPDVLLWISTSEIQPTPTN